MSVKNAAFAAEVAAGGTFCVPSSLCSLDTQPLHSTIESIVGQNERYRKELVKLAARLEQLEQQVGGQADALTATTTQLNANNADVRATLTEITHAATEQNAALSARICENERRLERSNETFTTELTDLKQHHTRESANTKERHALLEQEVDALRCSEAEKREASTAHITSLCNDTARQLQNDVGDVRKSVDAAVETIASEDAKLGARLDAKIEAKVTGVEAACAEQLGVLRADSTSELTVVRAQIQNFSAEFAKEKQIIEGRSVSLTDTLTTGLNDAKEQLSQRMKQSEEALTFRCSQLGRDLASLKEGVDSTTSSLNATFEANIQKTAETLVDIQNDCRLLSSRSDAHSMKTQELTDKMTLVTVNTSRIASLDAKIQSTSEALQAHRSDTTLSDALSAAKKSFKRQNEALESKLLTTTEGSFTQIRTQVDLKAETASVKHLESTVAKALETLEKIVKEGETATLKRIGTTRDSIIAEVAGSLLPQGLSERCEPLSDKLRLMTKELAILNKKMQAVESVSSNTKMFETSRHEMAVSMCREIETQLTAESERIREKLASLHKHFNGFCALFSFDSETVVGAERLSLDERVHALLSSPVFTCLKAELEDVAYLCARKEDSSLSELGVSVQGEQGRRGAEINQVMKHSTAERAGLRVGDRVLYINGMKIDSQLDLSQAVSHLKPKSDLKITRIPWGTDEPSTLDIHNSTVSPVRGSRVGGGVVSPVLSPFTKSSPKVLPWGR